MYFSPKDDAVGIAQFLFSSPRGRVGNIDIAKVSARDWDAIKLRHGRVTLILFEGGDSDEGGAQDSYGHSYFRTNPRVSSDIFLLLRYGLPPGSPGRPLEKLGPGFYKIPPGYPNVGE
jgi:hypothetical protein